jgi:hypothetical protein
LDGSFLTGLALVRAKRQPAYACVNVSQSGLEDHDAADLSAGRSVFLPWARPKPEQAAAYTNAMRLYTAEQWRTAPAERYIPAVKSLSDVAVLVASRHPDGLAGLAEWFRAAGALVALGDDLDTVLARVLANPVGCGGLIVQIDGFGEIEDIVDQLMSFRRKAPAVPLILISAGFRQDRLGAERLALCDVSLRDPVGLGKMPAVLEQALQNNLMWQERLLSLSAPRADAPRKVIPRRVRPARASASLA